MTTERSQVAPSDYPALLTEYVRDRSESALYRGSLLSQACIESGLGPEDLVSLHFDALDGVLRTFSWHEQVRASADAQQFLLEVMIAYGVRFKEYLELKLAETLRDADARTARDRERARELERLETEKSEILAVIAHELRTPLTAVRGSLDMAARSIARGRVEQVMELIANAREALDRLSRLSGDLVEASRGEIPSLECIPQDLGSILQQACSWAAPSAAAKGITLTVDDGIHGEAVPANTDAALSIFGNLLSNAIRYTPDGGEVFAVLRPDGRDVCAEIRDTGIGMSPEVQDRIFEKFYRAPEASRVEARGLGLGLALVSQMVQAHQGRIEVDSSLGHGSTFRVFFPRQSLPAEENSVGRNN